MKASGLAWWGPQYGRKGVGSTCTQGVGHRLLGDSQLCNESLLLHCIPAHITYCVCVCVCVCVCFGMFLPRQARALCAPHFLKWHYLAQLVLQPCVSETLGMPCAMLCCSKQVCVVGPSCCTTVLGGGAGSCAGTAVLGGFHIHVHISYI